jgi:hypothetical protein
MINNNTNKAVSTNKTTIQDECREGFPELIIIQQYLLFLLWAWGLLKHTNAKQR